MEALVVRVDRLLFHLGMNLLTGLVTTKHHIILVGHVSVESVEVVNQFLLLMVLIY